MNSIKMIDGLSSVTDEIEANENAFNSDESVQMNREKIPEICKGCLKRMVCPKTLVENGDCKSYVPEDDKHNPVDYAQAYQAMVKRMMKAKYEKNGSNYTPPKKKRKKNKKVHRKHR